jgi:transglutaminase superfamily protein/transglutaminase TgpA-like protein
MSELKALLERAERAVSVVPLPSDGLDGLQRRRDRNRRRQRLSAGVLGIAVFVAAVGVVTTGLPFVRTETPVVPGAAGNGPALDPFISIGAQLSVDHPAVDLFKVETNDPQYWQLATLDQFDGESWRSSDPDGTKGGIEAGQIVHVSPPVTPPPDSQTRSTYTFTILSSNMGHALPVPEQIIPPTHLIDVPGDLGGDLTFDPYLDQTFVGGGLDEGDEYTIRSRIAVPTAGELDQVHNLPSVQYGRWTELPEDLDPRFEQIAQGWTADATSAYDKVLAIQRHFHSDGFTYSTDVDVADDAGALLTFLTQTKTGFCQQYASAMAVLVRELGLPARIAVGYQAGTLQDDGTYLVQSTDAHAWVEVFFEGYGWLPFEPTPGHGSHPNAQPGTYLSP